MIFLPPSHYRARARSIVFLAGPSPPPSLFSHRLLFSLTSLPHPPTRSTPSLPAGVTQGLTHSLIISSQCTVRNSLVTRTRTHVHLGACFPNTPPTPFHALARSLVRPLVGGHRLLDFIEFSSSARRHPVQTRIRQLTPLACGGSAIKPAVREVRSTARTAPARFFGATRIRDAAPSKFRC